MAEQTLRLLEDHSKSGVYQILNTVTGKRYVGSAVNFQQRWHSHRNKLKKGLHHSQRLQNSWNKHGGDAFQFIVLEYTSRELAVEIEQKYIDHHQSFDPKCGYNIVPKAGSTIGRKASPQAIQRQSEAMLRRFANPEARAELSRSHKARYKDPDARKRQADGLRKTWARPEIRLKIKAAFVNRWADPQERQKQSERVKKRYEDPEQRKKSGMSFLGKKHSAETIRKMSLAAFARKRKPRLVPRQLLLF
jgi:group I intron endonuclease